MIKDFTKLVILIALLESSTSSALSTEHPSKSQIESLVDGSECIILAEFKGFRPKKGISLSTPPAAVYKIADYFKGYYRSWGSSLKVRYDFEAKPGIESDWQFKPAMMPSKGSKWILFFSDFRLRDGVLSTYNGAKGRMPCTEKTKNTLLDVLENRRTRSQKDGKRVVKKSRLLYYQIDKTPHSRDKLKDFLERRSDSYSGIDAMPIYRYKR